MGAHLARVDGYMGQGEESRGAEVSDKDDRENTMEPVEQTVMCPGHEHLFPNAAIFNATRGLSKIFLAQSHDFASLSHLLLDSSLAFVPWSSFFFNCAGCS